MANFSPGFLDEVLSRTDIVELIGRHVELKRSGSNLMGLCPFHHEKTPSFSVSPDKQLYYCFGCGKGGGAFQFLMDHDGLSFPEAVEYLAEKAGLEIPRADRTSPESKSRNRLALQMLDAAAQAFARALHGPQGEKARRYLRDRGMPDAIVRDYVLGYAPPGYGFMQKVFAGQGREAQTLARLEALGLLFRGERGYGDRFRDRLMFAIRDRRGQVVGFGGRVLGEGEPKYLNSPETPWFHKSELLYGYAEHRDTIRRRRQLVVVEGYMDVLALAAHELKIGLAPLGTAISERQIREILRLCDAPVFCFDGDRAGRQAAWRALERMLPLLKAEYAPRFLYLPEGEDPDSLLRTEGGEAFERRMQRDAQPVLQTWLAGLKRMAGSGADGRARMAKKADAMLASMQDVYLRQAWQQEVEQATGISLRQARRRRPVERHDEGAPRPGIQLSPLQERFLAALLQQPERMARLPECARNFFVDNERVHALYSRAFSSMAGAEAENIDIARRLIREFPEEQNLISRWINQAPVQEMEFKGLLLDMEANDIRRRIRSETDLKVSIRLQTRLQQLRREQRQLAEELNAEQTDDTGA